MIPELPIQFDLPLARRLAAFAAKAYEDRGLKVENGNGLILYDSLTDAHVLVEDVGDAIVLAFRGTKNIRDWLIDMDFMKVRLASPSRHFVIPRQPSPVTGVTSSPAPTGEEPLRRPSVVMVHRGFLRAIDSLLPKIMKWLDGPQAGSAPRPLLITGHSLGGALAALAAFFLNQHGYHIRAVYTFASPRVGNAAWRAVYNGLNQSLLTSSPTLWQKTFRLVAAGDLVPLVPGLLDGYRHVGNEVFLKWEHSTFNIQHRTSNVQNVSRETRKTASGSAFAKPTARGDARPPGIIQINPSHVWEILCDEVRAARALRRFDLDFILKFHSLETDYLPLLGKQTHAETQRRGDDCGQGTGDMKMGTFSTQHSTPNAK